MAARMLAAAAATITCVAVALADGHRPGVPTPPVLAPPISDVDARLAEDVVNRRTESRFLAECVDRGGSRCCGQGGCCGLADDVLAPTVDLFLPAVDGALSTRTIERVLTRDGAAIAACDAREQLARGWLDTLDFDFAISDRGDARDVVVAGFDIAVARCVADVLRRTRFPRPAHGRVRVQSLFAFHPAGCVNHLLGGC